MNENATPPPPPADPPPPASPPPPTPPAGGGSGTTSSNRGIMVVLSYLWIFALIPLLTEKEDEEVQWHAKHGLVLFGAEIVFWVVVSVLSSILAAVTAGIGCLGCGLYPIISLVFLVVRILCIVKGLNGERFTVPMLSEFADRF